jgi:hypothetical protein
MVPANAVLAGPDSSSGGNGSTEGIYPVGGRGQSLPWGKGTAGMAQISTRLEKNLLREKMLGQGHGEIADEFACRYGLRPQAAWRATGA